MQCSLCLLPLLQKLGKRTPPLFKRQRKPFSLGMCFVLLYWIPAHQMTWQVLSFILHSAFFPYLTWDSLTSPIFSYNCPPPFRALKHVVVLQYVKRYISVANLFGIYSEHFASVFLYRNTFTYIFLTMPLNLNRMKFLARVMKNA